MATTGSTVGINTAKISAMQKALSDYIAEVNKKVEISATRTVIQKAIKGSATENSLIELNPFTFPIHIYCVIFVCSACFIKFIFVAKASD